MLMDERPVMKEFNPRAKLRRREKMREKKLLVIRK